ncbi:MAG: polyprenyl synthetase family protein [Proteobacteria bacterium]|nr:polyprenyl synthetase family protein [Pseudomonadota bacterium]
MLVEVSDLNTALEKTAEELQQKMDVMLPRVLPQRVGESRLAEAMRYAALGEGKRLRPFLVVTSASLFGVSKPGALQAAAAIEFIHSYSLIHDDLPAIDDDDERRGKPSAHKQFDEATAILAGDALLTYAFEILADPTTHADAFVRAELVLAVAKAAGPRGMVGGQMMDIASDTQKLSLEETTRLQRLKTGALFAISCEAGAILGKATPPLRNALRGYANDIGLAFQITDDILDAESEGKKGTKRKNKSAEKATFVSALGMDKAKRQAKMLCEQAVSHLDNFDKRASLLRELALFIINRKR